MDRDPHFIRTLKGEIRAAVAPMAPGNSISVGEYFYMQGFHMEEFKQAPAEGSIPAEKDWENWKDDLDTRCAYRQFGGKSLSEAADLFVENALYYQEDLYWMPKIPFRFYLRAYSKYLLSDRSIGDSDGASCYLRLIRAKLATDPDHILDIFESIFPSVQHVAKNQARYDADKEIYGDFSELFLEIMAEYDRKK